MIHPQSQLARDRLTSTLLASIAGRIERMESLLLGAQYLRETVMADKQQVLDEIQALRDLIAQDNAQDQAAVDALSAANQSLRARIQDLEDQGVNTDVYADIIGQLEGVRTMIQPINVNAAIQSVSATTRGPNSEPLPNPTSSPTGATAGVSSNTEGTGVNVDNTMSPDTGATASDTNNLDINPAT
jgi:cell division protein FtsB